MVILEIEIRAPKNGVSNPLTFLKHEVRLNNPDTYKIPLLPQRKHTISPLYVYTFMLFREIKSFLFSESEKTRIYIFSGPNT
jgi:hypothetical protein